MDVEHEFICALVDGADPSQYLDHNITEDWFTDEQHARVFVMIRTHYAKWTEMPSRSAIKANYPTYKLPRPEDPIEFLRDELRKQFVHSNITDSLLDIQDALTDGNPLDALIYMQDAVSQINTDATVLKDVMLTVTWEERLADYRKYRDDFEGGLRGLPTGFITLDQATMGLQPEQLITFVGLPKSGKSTLALIVAIAVQDYLTQQGMKDDKVLVIGFEMSNTEQAGRYDAFTSHISHHALLSGQMTEVMEAAMETTSRARLGGAEMILAADPSGMTTLSGIAAKIKEHKPVLCVVDGAYLLDDENGESKGTSQALTNITRGLKRMAQQFKIPIIVTTQALHSKVGRRSGVQLDSIGYTSSFAQDSDLVVAVEASDEDSDQQTLKIVASRIGPKLEVLVNWNWATGNFTEYTDDEGPKAQADAPKTAVDVKPSKNTVVAAPASTKRTARRPVKSSA